MKLENSEKQGRLSHYRNALSGRIEMRKKLDLSDLNDGLDNGRQGGLRISETVDDLPHTTFSRNYREWCKITKNLQCATIPWAKTFLREKSGEDGQTG